MAVAEQQGLVFDCPVCLGFFVNPRVLPCGHSLCGSSDPPNTCLRDLLQNRHPWCPIDRKDMRANGGKCLSDFPENYALKSSMEKNGIVPTKPKTNFQGAAKCTPISTTSSYEQCETHYLDKDYFCRDCKVTMCEKCWEGHNVERHTVVLFKIYRKEVEDQLKQCMNRGTKPDEKKLIGAQEKCEKVVNTSLEAGEQLSKVLKLFEKRREIVNNFHTASSTSEIARRKSSFLMFNGLIKEELERFANDAQEIKEELGEVLSVVKSNIPN